MLTRRRSAGKQTVRGARDRGGVDAVVAVEIAARARLAEVVHAERRAAARRARRPGTPSAWEWPSSTDTTGTSSSSARHERSRYGPRRRGARGRAGRGWSTTNTLASTPVARRARGAAATASGTITPAAKMCTASSSGIPAGLARARRSGGSRRGAPRRGTRATARGARRLIDGLGGQPQVEALAVAASHEPRAARRAGSTRPRWANAGS